MKEKTPHDLGGITRNAAKKTRVKKTKGRSLSSIRWLDRQLNDPYVHQSKIKGYRSRAAFKLLQLNEKSHFLTKRCRVIDLGCAPGGWCQILGEMLDMKSNHSQIIGIDLLAMDPIPNVTFLQLDFTHEEAQDILKTHISGPVNVVLSDMAPSSTGHSSTDHLRIIILANMALDFALQVLTTGGTFVAKVWQGGSDKELLLNLKKNFSKVQHIKPNASRKDSAEIYVLATGFKGPKEVNEMGVSKDI